VLDDLDDGKFNFSSNKRVLLGKRKRSTLCIGTG